MRWLRRTGVVATGLVDAVPMMLMAAFTAWMLSNRNDIAPQPRPLELQLAAPTLPDPRNAFFALIGLSAEAGRDPDAVGHALWQLNMARAAMPQQERFTAKGYEALNRQDEAAAGKRFPAVSGAPLFCKDETPGCVASWLAEPALLAAQRQQLAVQGARCDALWAPGMGFEERLPSPVNFAVDMAPHLPGATLCSRWWRSGAVLAWQQGQPQRALALLQQAGRLDAALLAASQSLVSNLVAATMARDTQALPEHNKALFDDFWVGVVAALDSGLPAAISHLDKQSALAAQRGWQWHNTIGYILHDVAMPSYTDHFRRAADLPLYSEAAALALAATAQRVPAAERAAWAQRQPLSATLRERLRWDESGQGFTVRTWLEEGQTQPIEPRQAIRFDWPAPLPG